MTLCFLLEKPKITGEEAIKPVLLFQFIALTCTVSFLYPKLLPPLYWCIKRASSVYFCVIPSSTLLPVPCY